MGAGAIHMLETPQEASSVPCSPTVRSRKRLDLWLQKSRPAHPAEQTGKTPGPARGGVLQAQQAPLQNPRSSARWAYSASGQRSERARAEGEVKPRRTTEAVRSVPAEHRCGPEAAGTIHPQPVDNPARASGFYLFRIQIQGPDRPIGSAG